MDLEIEEGATATETLEPQQSLADSALEAVGLPPEDKETSGAPPVDELAPAPIDGKPPEEKKPVDPKSITDEDLQRPDHLSHKGRDRFEKLVGGYKAEKARADEVSGQLEQMQESFKALQDLGFRDEASAQDLIEFSKYRASLGGDGKEAIQILQKQIRMIEMRTGQNVQASALETHDDLAQEVRSERLPYERALEIAKARDQMAAQERQNQQFQQRQQQTFQSEYAKDQAINSVEGLESNWKATDPDYAAIQPHILAEMPNIAAQFPPHLWPQQVQILYSATKRAMSAQARPAYGSQPQPLRGNGHAASRAVPKTAAQAALQSLGMDFE